MLLRHDDLSDHAGVTAILKPFRFDVGTLSTELLGAIFQFVLVQDLVAVVPLVCARYDLFGTQQSAFPTTFTCYDVVSTLGCLPVLPYKHCKMLEMLLNRRVI